jgi:hypothetical protein
MAIVTHAKLGKAVRSGKLIGHNCLIPLHSIIQRGLCAGKWRNILWAINHKPGVCQLLPVTILVADRPVSFIDEQYREL